MKPSCIRRIQKCISKTARSSNQKWSQKKPLWSKKSSTSTLKRFAWIMWALFQRKKLILATHTQPDTTSIPSLPVWVWPFPVHSLGVPARFFMKFQLPGFWFAPLDLPLEEHKFDIHIFIIIYCNCNQNAFCWSSLFACNVINIARLARLAA